MNRRYSIALMILAFIECTTAKEIWIKENGHRYRKAETKCLRAPTLVQSYLKSGKSCSAYNPAIKLSSSQENRITFLENKSEKACGKTSKEVWLEKNEQHYQVIEGLCRTDNKQLQAYLERQPRSCKHYSEKISYSEDQNRQYSSLYNEAAQICRRRYGERGKVIEPKQLKKPEKPISGGCLCAKGCTSYSKKLIQFSLMYPFVMMGAVLGGDEIDKKGGRKFLDEFLAAVTELNISKSGPTPKKMGLFEKRICPYFTKNLRQEKLNYRKALSVYNKKVKLCQRAWDRINFFLEQARKKHEEKLAVLRAECREKLPDCLSITS